MNKIIDISIGLALLALLLWNPYPLQVLKLKSFDWLMSTQEPVQDEMILLVDIDEEIIEASGGYPLPRSLYASLLERSQVTNGITVLMPDPDIRDIKNDYILAGAMQQNLTVLAYAASTQASEGGPHVGTAQLGEDPTSWLLQYPGILRQTPVLAESAEGVGLINSAPEVDGVVRRLPVVVTSQGKLYPSFGLEMLRVGVGDPSYQISTQSTGVEWIRIPNYPKIVTDPNARVWITSNVNFYRQSAADFLRSPMEGAGFIIFGVTAEGVVNPVPTAKGPVYPHEIQANVLHHLVNGTSPAEPVWAKLASFGGTFVLLVLLLFVTRNIYLSLPSLLIAFGGLWYSTLYFFKQGLLFDVSGIALIIFLFWTIVTFRNFIEQFLLRRQIKGQFSTYLSPDMVNMLVKDPSLMKLGGERKEMTFLFTDIMGFTPVSEAFKKNDDPEGLVDLINTYLDSMTKIILNNGGTIDKYMGDCIMAFWNAPLPCDNHADMAVKSAIEINAKTEELNKQFKDEGLNLPPINVGTGVNTGTCIVGNMGSESRFDYSVIGDAVNLAARLEATAGRNDYKEWKIIVSDFTMKECKDFTFESIGDILVKGKSEPISIYSVNY